MEAVITRTLLRWARGPLPGVVVAILAGWIFLFLDYFQLDQTLVFASYDLPFRWRGTVHVPEIVIIDMDDASHRQLQESRFGPWHRQRHADLLRQLATAATGPVILDLSFYESDPGDAAFADALRVYPTNVILASSLDPVGRSAGGVVYQPILPQSVLLDAAERPGSPGKPHGFTEVVPDRDGVVREFWPVETAVDGREIPRLVFRAYQVANPAGASAWLDRYRRLGMNRGLNYYGSPARSGFLHVPYFRALETSSNEVFRGRFVFVGANPALGYTGAGKDTFFHPYHRDSFIPGLEIHATMLANLLRDESLTRLPTVPELLILTALGWGIGLVLSRPAPGRGLVVAAILGLAIPGVAVLSVWVGHVWFPWLIPVVIQIPAALLVAYAQRFVHTHVEAQRLRHSFGLYASEDLATAVGRNPELLHLGSVPRELSVLFSDIASFCRIGERLDQDDFQRLLQGYYDVALECIFEKRGMVMNIIGDSIFAVWNTPLSPQPDHARLACEAAVLLQQRLEELNHRRDTPNLATRIGLHTGLVNVGNFGTGSRMVYTAIGEAVNLASRLEGLNKYLGTRTLASRTTQKAVEQTVPSRRVGYFRFLGFDRPIEVVELLRRTDGAPNQTAWLEAFAEGLHRFRHRDFQGAEAEFRRALSLRPEDGVARFYLDEELPRARHLRADDTTEFGVVILPGK